MQRLRETMALVGVSGSRNSSTKASQCYARRGGLLQRKHIRNIDWDWTDY
jgi:hypothetical protein